MRDDQKGSDKIGWLNVIWSIILGAGAAGAIYIWGVPGLDPSLWDETAVVAGIRPPNAIFPGLWRV